MMYSGLKSEVIDSTKTVCTRKCQLGSEVEGVESDVNIILSLSMSRRALVLSEEQYMITPNLCGHSRLRSSGGQRRS